MKQVGTILNWLTLWFNFLSNWTLHFSLIYCPEGKPSCSLEAVTVFRKHYWIQGSKTYITALTVSLLGCVNWGMASSLVQFSCSFMSNSLQPHGLHHARPPSPSPIPRAYSNSFHHVGDATQPSHPLLSPSPPTFNLSQHQDLFQWIGSSHQVARVL